jgi:peptidoglycan hydrolase-like protein with peptidoglycan-binding domain
MSPPRPVRNIPMPETTATRPPDPIGEIIAPPARRVSAVQRVLSDYGYGQIKPTGTLDRETQDAIEQFQRSKKLAVTRQITPELMRELAVLAGRPIE